MTTTQNPPQKAILYTKINELYQHEIDELRELKKPLGLLERLWTNPWFREYRIVKKKMRYAEKRETLYRRYIEAKQQ